ncbi:hypothetical protein NW766_010879 [Fusarium irregulare]|uniref:Uncharacterized protein n=1 Tax=Fusarium irregulare TaxID=2494466 RepID=A0A9W8PHC3_9HYPO|nr:hypothetical protein NW766_010879 [Fusarium irregulare]
MLVRLRNYLSANALQENTEANLKPVPAAMPAWSQSDYKLSPRACELPTCGNTEGNLLRCPACQAVYYCVESSNLEKAREAYVKEEQALEEIRTSNNESLFDLGVGYFWDINHTRDYMRARHDMVNTLLEVFGGPGGREETVEEALGHLLDMLRLSRGDGMRVRDTVPGLYIRLGEEQAAYDFMKWYAINHEEDWSDETRTYLDINNADIFEDPLDIWVVGPSISLAHVAAVLLIKVRILLDLQAAQSARRALRGSIPAEIIELIRSYLVISGRIVKSRPDILLRSVEDLANLIQRIKGQVRRLYESINRNNPHFWNLIQEERFSGTEEVPAPVLSEADLLKMRHALKRDNLASWAETRGAFDVIQSLGADFDRLTE